MKNRPIALGALAALAIVGLLLLSGVNRSGLPRAGDTVSPRLVQETQWEPGGEGQLWVELAATDQSGDSRRLSFSTMLSTQH